MNTERQRKFSQALTKRFSLDIHFNFLQNLDPAVPISVSRSMTFSWKDGFPDQSCFLAL